MFTPFNFIIIFLIAILSILLSIVSTSPEKREEIAECKVYRRIENMKHCGNNSYLIHYGEANCQRFNRQINSGEFSDVGIEWIHCTTKCLGEELQRIHHEDPLLSCDILESKAFSTHVPCYLNCHFCNVCKTQKWSMFKTYRIRDFLNLHSIHQVYQIINECGLFTCFQS